MIDKTIEKKVNKMNNFDSKQKLVNFIFYFLCSFFVVSLLLFPIVIIYAYNLIKIRTNTDFLYYWFFINFTFILFIFPIYFLEFTPLSLIPLISYKHTNYTGFLYESLIELQFIIIIYIIIFIQLFVPIPIYIIVTIIPFFIAIGYKFLKKPVIQGWIVHNTNEFDRSGVLDIVENQTLHVNDFQDGYSSRPVFDTFNDIFDNSYSKQEITSILSSFAKFIAINGDLISFDIQEQMIKLYFRTALIHRNNLLNFFLQFKYLRSIYQKKDLTCITFNLDSMEISFKLNENDYEKLTYVTFNKLANIIVDRFKAGITQFLNKNYASVYVIINPTEDARSFMYYHKGIKYIY